MCPEELSCVDNVCRRAPEAQCPDGGQEFFCGRTLGLDPRGLFRCEAGVFTPSEACANGCEPRREADDVCAPACPEGPGLYCGEAIDREPGTLYQCGAGLVPVATCARSCEIRDGDDGCAGR